MKVSTIAVVDHLSVWHMSQGRLHWHLERNHNVSVPSNPADWSTLHVVRHETAKDHSLEIPAGCSCRFDDRWGASDEVGWHRRHRAHHLQAFPDVDQVTSDNLDSFIAWAERTAS